MAAPGRLQSVLGLGFGLAGAVGGTIGAGILRTPGLVAAQLGSTPLIAACWLLGGAYAVLGAVCVAELAAALPRAGGWWVYAERAFGRRAGVLTGWTDWLAHCIGLAWVATTTGELVLALLPPHWLASALLAHAGEANVIKAIALTVIALFSLIQWRGVKAGSSSQELLSLAKAGAFAALVVACFVLSPSQELSTQAVVASAQASASDSGPGALLLPAVLALQAVITTYDGWASPVYFAEEFSNPGRDLPRSLIGGVLAVLLLVLLINAGLLRVLPLPLLASSTLPAATAAEALVGPAGALVISAIALVALLGLVNTVVMAAPRILYGLASTSLLPPPLATVNAGGTPTAALLLTSTSAAGLVLLGSFERLLAMGAVLYVSLPLIGMAALLALRQQEPELERPFRCWGYPLTPLLIAAGSLAFVLGAVATDPLSSLAALALAAAALALPAAEQRPAAASGGPPDSPGT